MAIKKKSPSTDQFGLYQTQVQTYVGLTSLMTAIVSFFVGFLLTTFHDYDISIRVPIAFLIVALFGLLYATLIYANAAEESSQMRAPALRRNILLGDIISEYLGTYLLVVSIPLVVNVITPDVFLRLITILSALVGLTVYQFSHVSIIERHFTKKHKLPAALLVLFGIALFAGQIFNFHFILFAIGFIVFLLVLTLFAAKRNLAKAA